MSTEERPKQFIDVLGVGRTLLQMTRDRFKGICPAENVWVVTNKRYASLVKEQLPDIPESNILQEPCRRNTAPCIAYVSWRIKVQDPMANIVVTPSDHVVTDVVEFQRVVGQCLKFTQETDAIVTLGMKPNRPETGYGYIQADLSTNSLRNKELFRVDQFREKPDLATAKQYIQENNYFWNAGIFIWRVETIVNALRMYAPRINRIFERLQDKLGTPEEQQIIDDIYGDCDNISIDYAEGRRQGLRVQQFGRECAEMKATLAAAGVEELSELEAMAAELEAIGTDMVAECDRLLDIEKTMFSAHRGGGNAYV